MGWPKNKLLIVETNVGLGVMETQPVGEDGTQNIEQGELTYSTLIKANDKTITYWGVAGRADLKISHHQKERVADNDGSVS